MSLRFADALSVKVMALRYAGVCADCSTQLPPGARAGWDSVSRTVHCLTCTESPAVGPAPAQILQRGAGGESALREYHRRSQRRDQQVRAAHPKLGGLILAVTSEPTSTRVWAQGAAGEQAVAATLEELVGDHVTVLHDRMMRGSDGRLSRANIDHLAVAPGGVWVIDAKTHRGALEVRRSGGLFSPRVEKLYIAGRDQTSLLAGLRKQVAAVRNELATAGTEVLVRGALCFVGTELPWFGESVDGVPLVGRRGLAKLLKRVGDLQAADRDAIARLLANRFPAAR